MHTYMYSSLYTCNCTVLYFSFFSENKNINVNVIFYQIFMIALQKHLNVSTTKRAFFTK